jgi:hypothetical protein
MTGQGIAHVSMTVAGALMANDAVILLQAA